ncbi:uncharacterized protein LOC114515665 [Dendronephthya gigantea]|uniref:uncharacterized protein LOC114515665 n=1 Tax=Dendronephthya gigantea TaxID=151771 RepID=UPI00106C7C62|nr:uncharacterized protein LOC114515665 [Dendronephthya gigantea]
MQKNAMGFGFIVSTLWCVVLSSANAVSHRESLVRKSNIVEARQIAAKKCNGLPDLCDLRIDQVTYPASHNAGSGFDGLLYWGSGGAAPSCSIRNHDKSYSEQLEYGIRYFDVDTCYGDKEGEALNCHCGADCGYTGSIKKGLEQIDRWMQSHPNEVALIHFNHNVQKGYEAKIARSIEDTLLKLWPSNAHGKLAMNSFYNTYHYWPKLKDAIQSNERIFILVAEYLYQNMPSKDQGIVLSKGLIASTWGTNPVTSSCSGITQHAKDKCSTSTTFIDLSAFGSYGLCTWEMATICSKWLGEAAFECLKLRKTLGKTVNFLLVDWAEYYSGGESVINKAKFMNEENIKTYLGKSIFFPELTGCSYHSGWFYNYCWKYCPKYGWCWINKYCGKDPDICKKQDYPCYSSCG